MHDWLEATIALSGLCLVVSSFYWIIEGARNAEMSADTTGNSLAAASSAGYNRYAILRNKAIVRRIFL